MTFTYDPTSDRGKVRLLLGDTAKDEAEKQIFTDDEIDAFLTLEGNEIYAAAAAGARSLAANAAHSAIVYKASNLLEIDRSKVPDHYRALAETLEQKAKTAPHEEIDSVDLRIDAFGGDHSEYVGDVII